MFFNHQKEADGFFGRRIGIVGLGPRNGVTHISIALSNYLSENRHKRVCLAECNRHNDLKTFIRSLGENRIGNGYTFHRVTYIPEFDEEQSLPDIDFDCMVFDLGHDLDRALNTMKICDLKIAVAADAPWRNGETAGLNETAVRRTGISGWRIFYNLGNPERLKEKGNKGIISGCFPFEPDPVYPSRETIAFLEEIL